MDLSSNKINFTSLANLNRASIVKHMPQQEKNILGAVKALEQNPQSDQVSIEALSPDIIKLERTTEKGEQQTTNVVDIRKTFALFKFQFLENFYSHAEGGLNPETRQELVHQFKQEVADAKSKPYDFGYGILKEYANFPKQ